MNVPVPRNRLVVLTLLGVVLTGLVSVTLASPTLLLGDDNGGDAEPSDSNTVASDAPTPNQNFTPAVQQSDDSDYEDEDEEEYEDEEKYEDEDEEEREDD